MNISIRNEIPADYRTVEELTREAFWGNTDHTTCDGEHLLVHKLRKLPAFVPELDFVAEAEGKIIGHIIYSLAKIVTPDNREIKVLNFGPLSVHPNYRRMGVGSALMHHSIAEAARQGYRAIIFYGHPDYYPRFGFRRASRYGIVSADGSSRDSLMSMELYDGALDGITGRYIEDEVYEVDKEEMAEFEKGFPYKEPVQLLPAEILTTQLPERVKQTFEQHGIRFVAQLQRISGAELLKWDGMDEQLLKKVNNILSKLGQPCKLLPSSYIFQLTEMGVRNPVCSLIRSKAGISLYRVESEGKKLILKVFDKQEDAREIDNYLILSKLEIPTLPLLGYTKNAILMPDVDAANDYRLGKESDLSDPKVARAIAKWYRLLHKKGSDYLSAREAPMYDESDMLTADNMKLIAEKTGTAENMLWQAITENYSTIRSRIDALPRTLTYNDFYWTNLIVSKTGECAFMFDYNLLGKGIAYGDIRNVVSSLSHEAEEAFIQEYGDGIDEDQKKADAFIAPLVTLVSACRYETFPFWAKDSLEELKNGDVLRRLKEWLSMDFIFIVGPSAVGKTTLAKSLYQHYEGVYLEQNMVPEFVVPNYAEDVGIYEEQLCWDNVLLQLKFFYDKGLRNIVALDFDDVRTRELPLIFKGYRFIILRLISSAADQIKRQMTERHNNEGGLYVPDYVERSNQVIMERKLLSNEVMIDIAGKTKEEVLKEAVNIIDCFEPAIDYNYKPDDEHNYLSWVQSRKLF